MYLELAASEAACTKAVLLAGTSRMLLVYGIQGREGESLEWISRLFYSPATDNHIPGIRSKITVGNKIPTPKESQLILPCWLTFIERQGRKYLFIGHFGARRFQFEWKYLSFEGSFTSDVQAGYLRLGLTVV